MTTPVAWNVWAVEAHAISNPRPVAKLSFSKPADWSDERWDAYLREVDRRIDIFNRLVVEQGEEAAHAYFDSLPPADPGEPA